MAEARRAWSRIEVEATVAAYLEMLTLERKGIPYSKTEHRRRLRSLLDGRSDAAIERKHQNISAILIEEGFPYIDGYKPLGNYQELLREVVRDRLSASQELISVVRSEIEAEVTVPDFDGILTALVNPPERRRRLPERGVRQAPPPRYGQPVNYLLREAANSALGLAGESFILSFERARLAGAGHEGLAGKVEHVALTRGDHEGFDILSFELDGQERLIEVKTTGFGAYTPFYVTRNELEVSRGEEDRYHLYRLFDFRRNARFFMLGGALDVSCELEASQYLARVG